MKKYSCLVSIILVLLFVQSAFAGWSSWNNYVTLNSGGQPLVQLEFRTKHAKGWYPQVQWRATNLSSRTLYCASIGRRHYDLSNGDVTNNGSEGCYKIVPGKTQKYMSDTIGAESLRVMNVTMEYYSFSFEKIGSSQRINIGSVKKNQSKTRKDKVQASPFGRWDVEIHVAGKVKHRKTTMLTFSRGGTGRYYSYKDSENYLARWSRMGNHISMKVFATQYHYDRNEPGILLELDMKGNRISGTQGTAIPGFHDNDYVITGHKL